MTNTIEVRCGYCGRKHYLYVDGGSELCYCTCEACGGTDMACLYDAFLDLYPLEELDFIFANEDPMDRLHLFMDVVYQNYGEYACFWAKRKAFDNEEFLERMMNEGMREVNDKYEYLALNM